MNRPIFKMGLQTGNGGGTALGLNVLDGFVNVGVDRRRYPGYGGYGGNRGVYVNVG